MRLRNSVTSLSRLGYGELVGATRLRANTTPAQAISQYWPVALWGQISTRQLDVIYCGAHPLAQSSGSAQPEGVSASARSRRPGQNRLTGQRRTGRWRTRRVTLASVAPSHVGQRSTSRHRRSHWGADRQRRAHRDRCTDRSTDRQRRAHWHRCTDGHRRTHGSTDGQRPGQSHRDTGHVRDRRAGGNARARPSRAAGGGRSACCRRGASATRRRLDAGVATHRERGGGRVRAQRNGGCAQSGAGNYFDVEPIEDRHQRQLPIRRPSPTASLYRSRASRPPQLTIDSI